MATRPLKKPPAALTGAVSLRDQEPPKLIRPVVSAPVETTPDINRRSSIRPLPKALAYLRGATDASVDDAIVEALPHMEPEAQSAALKILIDRGHEPSLASVVALFHGASQSLKELLTAHINELAVGVRLALSSNDFDHRAGAIEAVVAVDDTSAAYHLVERLRSSCLRTRELAGMALRSLTASWLEKVEAARGEEPQTSDTLSPYASRNVGERLESQKAALISALAEGVRTWELHLQPRVLEASLWMGASILPAFRGRLDDERGGLSRIVAKRLENVSDARMAEFVWCALGIPALRSAAAHGISVAKAPAFIAALGRQSDWLGDPEIERGFRHVRQCPWLESPPDTLLRLLDDDAAVIVQLIAAMGGSQDRKFERFRQLVNSGDERLIGEVLRAVMNDPSDAAGEMLAIVARRGELDAACLAESELQRRQLDAAVGPASDVERDGSTETHSPVDPWDQLFVEWERFSEFDRANRLSEIGLDRWKLGAKLRAKLRGAFADDRRKGLVVIRDCSLAKDFADEIYRLAHDADAVVRSLAIALLTELPGATSERVLRVALEDADPRVQANAIEALDTLDAVDRRSFAVRKLTAADNRVRANAIQALLKRDMREAGEALLEMLEDDSGAHRLSALWVIERLRLHSVIHRVIEMSRRDPDERVRQRAARVVASVPLLEVGGLEESSENS